MFSAATLIGLLAATASGHGTTLVLGGDIMLNQISVNKKPLLDLKVLFDSGNVGLANLEIPITRSKSPTPFKTAAELRARTQYILKADPGHAASLASSGIDLVSLANNHAMDYRAAGLLEEIAMLDRLKIAHAGGGQNITEARRAGASGKVRLLSALAFMNTGSMTKLVPATKDSPGIHALIFNGKIDDTARTYIKQWIAESKRVKTEILVVGLHWGIERQTVPTPYQVALARACIDAGADVVWGHHPHVLQGAELYKGKPILYSMGNLISKKEGPSGLVRLYFEGRTFRKARFIPLQISGGRTSQVVGESSRPVNYKNLGTAIQRRYPNPQSKSMPLQ